MKNKILVLLITIISVSTVFGQGRGVKIGYIDMNYILDKVPAYAEATNQLEQKAQKWKEDIELKKNEINKLKENLATEKPLLTKELLEEREEEIKNLETDLLDYQQARFGAQGDLMIQKATLVKPIQDQVFNIIQELAEAKKYDFIFDKSSDMTMLFAAQRYDISKQVLDRLLRAEKREKQLTKKQQKAEEAKEKAEEAETDNPALAERNKKIQEKREAREAEKLKKAEDRKKMLEDRKNGTSTAKESSLNDTDKTTVDTKNDELAKREAAKKEKDDERKRILEERQAKRDSLKNAATQKADEKKATISKEKETIVDDLDATLPAIKETTTTEELIDKDTTAVPTEAKAEDREALRKKNLEERNKKLEDRKKAAEEKRKKAIADREAAKTENKNN